MRSDSGKLASKLREFSLGFPGATEDFPWGERVAKVKGKVFVFLGKDGHSNGELSFSVKLPSSGEAALEMPFTEPTGYGLGKSGWVTVRVAHENPPPINLLTGWIEESYRAIAPKKLITDLDSTRTSGRSRGGPKSARSSD